MRVVVVARAVVDLAARMAALDLDRGVTYGKLRAEPALQIANDVFRVAKRVITHHHVTAERHLVRR